MQKMASVNTSIPDVFRGFQLGIVMVFGVLLPGVWFWASVSIYFVSSCSEESIRATFTPVAFLDPPPSLSWIVGFVAVYAVGSQMRAFAPNFFDRLSIRWCHLRYGEGWLIKRNETFPYSSLKTYFERHVAGGFSEFTPWSDEVLTPACSTMFVNYSKLYVTSRSPHLGDYLSREEAFIRAMSGVAWAALTSSCIGIVILAIAALTTSVSSFPLFLLTFGVNAIVLVGIVVNLHRQRLRELTKVIGALYLLIKDTDKSHPPWYVPNEKESS